MVEPTESGSTRYRFESLVTDFFFLFLLSFFFLFLFSFFLSELFLFFLLLLFILFVFLFCFLFCFFVFTECVAENLPEDSHICGMKSDCLVLFVLAVGCGIELIVSRIVSLLL